MRAIDCIATTLMCALPAALTLLLVPWREQRNADRRFNVEKLVVILSQTQASVGLSAFPSGYHKSAHADEQQGTQYQGWHCTELRHTGASTGELVPSHLPDTLVACVPGF